MSDKLLTVVNQPNLTFIFGGEKLDINDVLDRYINNAGYIPYDNINAVYDESWSALILMNDDITMGSIRICDLYQIQENKAWKRSINILFSSIIKIIKHHIEDDGDKLIDSPSYHYAGNMLVEVCSNEDPEGLFTIPGGEYKELIKDMEDGHLQIR